MADIFTLFGTIAIDSSGARREIDSISGKAGGLSKTFNKIGQAAVSIGKKAMVGMAAVGTGVTALAKSSIKKYAVYEQLVGGVETLFSESAGKVMSYAQNAYKTAGLSANQYMETVTAFSSSLLQSMDGDTAAAADMANMAVTDMSDNANKMGTSMASIQNAYQGFAKQNYTMLDNLKLGYGGTKTEMQRLLKDAGKLAGKKYNIKNLNDVIEAIHVVQTEIGITGTTAKEASETISGSWNSTKSAWANLLIGLSDGNADIDSLFDNLTESAGNVVKNVAKVVPTLARNLVRTVGNLASTAGQKLGEAWENNVYPYLQETLKAKFGIELPNWANLKDTITTKWGEVKAALSDGDFAKAFQIILPSWDTVKQGISDGWNGIVWPFVQTAFKTVFGVELPDWGTIATSIIDGWNLSIWPKVQGIFSAVFGISLPEWGTVWQDIQTWWENVKSAYAGFFNAVFSIFTEDSDGKCVAERIIEWGKKVLDSVGNLFSVAFGIDIPTVDEIATQLEELGKNIQKRWTQVKRSLGFTVEEDDGSSNPENYNGGTFEDYHNSIENGDGSWWPQGEVSLAPSADSESIIQSAVEKYGIEGAASIKADPKSKNLIQSYLDTLNLSALVKLTATGLSTGTVTTGAVSKGRFLYNSTNAAGLWRVPHDGYIANLHKDETVLKASEAAVYRGETNAWRSAAARRGSAGGEQPLTVNLTVNGVSSSPREIASEVRNALELMRWRG